MNKVSHQATSNCIYIGPNERPWAMPRNYQRFWGHYQRDKQSGLYFAKGSKPELVKLIADTFARLPECYQELCWKWKITISFAEGYTACGNSSTFYADFSRQPEQYISPHIEIGDHSLKPNKILAHLAHEVSHLFWRTRGEAQRRAFRAFMEKSCGPDTTEITLYIQSYFSEYLDSLKLFQLNKVHPNLHDGNMMRWTEESFCDTVAHKLAGKHPDYQTGCTVKLRDRMAAMRDHLDLDL